MQEEEVIPMNIFMTKKRGSDERSPQMQALVNGTLIKGCMLDGRVVVNVKVAYELA